MKINREILNVIILSWGYSITSGIQSVLYQEFMNYERCRLIFHVALTLCILLAPSYVTLAGTRISILTSYVCHIFFVSTFLWPNPKWFLVSSAFLGFGASLVFVAQGKCLTENKNSQTIHRHSWIFWLFIEIFCLIHDLFNIYILPIIIGRDNINESEFKMFNIISIIIVFSVSLVFLIREPTKEYTFGGLECIPNGKVIEAEEAHNNSPFLDLWIPFKNIFYLSISMKMLLIYVLVSFTGFLMMKHPASYDMFHIVVRVGEISGAFFSAFCFCNKNGDSVMIIFVGLLMLATSFSCTSVIAFHNHDNPGESFNKLSEDRLFSLNRIRNLESFSFGFGEICFQTQIYSLVGALFPKTSASAFSLIGLCYLFSHLFGYNYLLHWHLSSHLRFLLIFGIFATISVVMIEHFYVNRSSDSSKPKKTLKSKNSGFKNVKTVSPEIKMVYASFNNNETEQFPISNVEITNEKKKELCNDK